MYNTSHQKILGQSTCYFPIWPPGGYNHLQNPGEGTGRGKILSSSKVVRIKGGRFKFIGGKEGSEKKEKPHGHYSISIMFIPIFNFFHKQTPRKECSLRNKIHGMG